MFQGTTSQKAVQNPEEPGLAASGDDEDVKDIVMDLTQSEESKLASSA